MWIQKAYATMIEDALEPLKVSELSSVGRSGDIGLRCVNGKRSLEFFILMAHNEYEFKVDVQYVRSDLNKLNFEKSKLDPFQETLKSLASWLKESS